MATIQDPPAPPAYERALAAEPRLRAVENMVRAQVLFIRPGDTFCHGCYWERVLKPLVTPLVGWGRGEPHEDAADPHPSGKRVMHVTGGGESGVEERDNYVVVTTSWHDAFAQMDAEPEPTTATERWLRSTEAWDVVTDYFLEIVQAADPANGHGFAIAEEA
jgi:hypothetical protein